SYKANSFIEVKGTFGYQMLESQDPSYYSDSVLRGWVAANQAIGFKGNAYYLDIMPLFHLPFERHIDRGNVNIYAGVGLGVMFVDKEDRKSTRLNSSHVKISYAVFCLKKKNILN